MLIQSLAQKTKLAMMTVFATIVGCALICGFTVWSCIALVNKERQQIYILDGDIPFLAQRAQLEANFTMEARAHIQLFHQYFFNLPPDNDYIKWTVGKAMYMADGTALKQKQALDENGFYSDIISSSAVCTIMCDSINFDEHQRKFTYYGTQLIKRRTRDLKRSMVTTGYIENVPRTQNNSLLFILVGDMMVAGMRAEMNEPNVNMIANVEPIFNGFRTIQANKDAHRKTILDMTTKGQTIRHELDSMIAIPAKSHEDSIGIIRRYNQLDNIVKSLKQNDND